MNGQDKLKGFALIVDSWLFYLIVLGFGFLAIYLMDIGIFKWYANEPAKTWLKWLA